MIQKKQIEKNGVLNYVITFFKNEYKTYFLGAAIVLIPFIVIYFSVFTDSKASNTFLNLNNFQFKNLTEYLKITILAFAVASQIIYGVNFKNKSNNKLKHFLISWSKNILSVVTILIFGLLVFILFNLIQILFSRFIFFIPIFTFVGALCAGSSFFLSVLFLNNPKKILKKIKLLIKTDFVNVLNTLTILTIICGAGYFIIPLIINLIQNTFSEFLGLTYSYKITEWFITCSYLILSVFLLHCYIQHFYILTNEISNDVNTFENGKDINEIGNETLENDELL